MNSSKKQKYVQIPIVSHNSEKPSLIFEEICSGKYIKSNKNNKKYKEIPIIAHDSEKPSLVFEEISFDKQYSKIQTSSFKNKDKIEKKQQKCTKKEKCNTSVPIHDSQMPSTCFEETNSGKMYSNIQTSLTNYKEKENKIKDGKKNLKKEKCNKTKIQVHESEKPSMIFEEINAGIRHKFYPTSVSEYKEDKQSKKLRATKNKKPEKKSNIVVHESEKPSFVFEQSNSGKLFSFIKTSETDYNKIKNLKKVYEYKDIPIVVHNSEKPSLVFEEINTGITYGFSHLL